jgi:hypothetical protein
LESQNFPILPTDTKQWKKLMKKDFTILEAGLVDRIGRIYKQEDLEASVKKLASGVYGEIGQGVELRLSPDRISHIVENIRFEDGKMIGTVRTLDTPTGNIVHEMDAAKVGLRTAIRGIGKVNEAGVVEDYELVSIDIVMDT